LAQSLLAGDEPPAPRCRMKKDRRAAFDLNQGNEMESGFSFSDSPREVGIMSRRSFFKNFLGSFRPLADTNFDSVLGYLGLAMVIESES
jgi:hypothetical protein